MLTHPVCVRACAGLSACERARVGGGGHLSRSKKYKKNFKPTEMK